MIMNNKIIAFASITALSLSTAASARTISYPGIYPFVPFEVEKINSTVRTITEDDQFINNFHEIVNQDLSKAKTEVKPWTSTYWPMNKGLIADPYESTFIGYYIEKGSISWTTNYKKFKRRKRSVHARIDKLTSTQLNYLAPSEKYDLLLGDKSFDLTNRLWDYMHKWGTKKEYGFLHSVDISGDKTLEIAQNFVDLGWFKSVEDAFMNAYQIQGSLAPEYALELVKEGKYESVEDAMEEAISLAIEESSNYVLGRKNQFIAFWEGICHGWATSAGIVNRPRNTVKFELPDGRLLKFYPSDIKGLVAQLWASSMIQNNKWIDKDSGENIGGGVMSAGLRCNLKNPKTDIWGRLYDDQSDPFNKDHSPRCVGVHPAVWHLGLVNLIGKQGRSFIVERKVGEAVDNHPMYRYTMKYFNPNDGNLYTKLDSNIVEVGRRDQFKYFRNPKAKYIVGVVTWMTYIDWQRPIRYLKDHEGLDKTDTKKMYYDLELDENYNIIGGQWRAKKIGQVTNDDMLNHNQPDFFWAITKDWKPFFKEVSGVEKWTDLTKAPPASWKKTAIGAHKFIYQKKFEYGTGQKCTVYHKRIRGKKRDVSCEYEEPRPQPFVNLVNKLIQLSQ
jgi:hypothetical protein